MGQGRIYTGGCLCGAFQFEVEGPLTNIRLCHCDLCRKANGSAFSANCKVPRSRFTMSRDDGDIRRYQSSPGAWRVFCGTCGTPIFSDVEYDADHIRIRLDTLDREAEAQITAHVWVGSKAAWDTICDDLPCFDKAAE